MLGERIGGGVGERTTVYFPRDYEIAFSGHTHANLREKPETFSGTRVYLGKFSPIVSEDKYTKSKILRW